MEERQAENLRVTGSNPVCPITGHYTATETGQTVNLLLLWASGFDSLMSDYAPVV